MRKKTKLVYGVGRNDAEYSVYQGEWRCPFYQVWIGMLKRSYCLSLHKVSPSYAGCSVAPEWHSLSAFKEWMSSKDWAGLELDKDILIPGNKVYGPDNCVFVTRALNTFVTDSGRARGEFPTGVAWSKSAGKFIATCKDPFAKRLAYLGYHSCAQDAHEAWRKKKHSLACAYADSQADERVADALRRKYLE